MKRNLLLFLLAFVVGTFAVAQVNSADAQKELLIKQSHGPTVDVPKAEPGSTRAIGDDCTTPIVVTLPAEMPYTDAGQTTCGRGNNYSSTCLSSYDGGEDIVYRLDVTADVAININMTSGSSWTGMLISQGCPDVGTCLAASGSSSGNKLLAGINLTAAGSPYFIMIDTWPSPACIPSFTLTIDAPPPPPANDLCADAITIACGETESGTTINATFDNVGFCGTNNTAPGVWYTFIAGTDQYTVSTCDAADFDTKITVFTGDDCNNLVCVDGNDDGLGCLGFTSELTFNTVQFETYYVLVHGYNTEQGDFDLTLTATPCITAQVPVSNWAILLGVLLIGTFIVVRYRRKLA